MDSGNISAVISASAGLAGVLTGAVLAYLKDRRAERIKDERDGSYLAILVVSHLDRFANGCWHVALDDGTSEGRPAGENGECRTVVMSPEFKPLDIEVEWKVLPKNLMYEILQIPDKREHIENQLSGVWEFDTPPDYSDFFWRRRRDYAELGLEVSGIAKRLRKHAGMPIVESSLGEWNRDASLQEEIDKVDKERAKYEKQQTISLD
ncbi:MAG: hypothetical protein ABI586_11475 [Candidatus Nanopelagicales bacterium]